MSAFLWVLQWLLAGVYLVAGSMKLLTPEEKMLANPGLAWVADAGITRTRTAGAAEIVGAIGLVVPGLLGVAEFLTPLAALGLATVMALAVITVHIPREESFAPPAVLGVLALVLAIGRFVEPL